MKVADQTVSVVAKLPQKSVFNYVEMNPRQEDSINPNSAILSYFQLGEFTYENYAIMQCLMSLLNEPFFNQLRNKEQLGYIVQAMFDGRNKGLAGHVMVQSNKYGPEYLESRINFVLNDLAQMKEPFKVEQVQKMKDKELATLSQKASNLAAETDKYWTYLQRDYVDQ